MTFLGIISFYSQKRIDKIALVIFSGGAALMFANFYQTFENAFYDTRWKLKFSFREK